MSCFSALLFLWAWLRCVPWDSSTGSLGDVKYEGRPRQANSSLSPISARKRGVNVRFWTISGFLGQGADLDDIPFFLAPRLAAESSFEVTTRLAGSRQDLGNRLRNTGARKKEHCPNPNSRSRYRGKIRKIELRAGYGQPS